MGNHDAAFGLHALAHRDRSTAADPAMALSIVIPVYGSEAILPDLVAQLAAMLADWPALPGRAEVILVCDASPDRSWSVIARLVQQHGFLRGIRLRRNVGQHNAILAGLRQAQGAVVVLMDDDLQHSPAIIPALHDRIRAGADACYVAFPKLHQAGWKRFGSAMNGAMAQRLLGKPAGLYLSSFKAIRREVAAEIGQFAGPFVYIDGLILRATGNIAAIPAEHRPRQTGAGNYSLRKSLQLWTAMATGFSVVPLRIAATLGGLVLGSGLLLALLFGVQGLALQRIPDGWSLVLLVVLVVGGAQLLALGIIGEYLGRVLLTAYGKPQYSIAETIAAGPANPTGPVT